MNILDHYILIKNYLFFPLFSYNYYHIIIFFIVLIKNILKYNLSIFIYDFVKISSNSLTHFVFDCDYEIKKEYKYDNI
jgi:hypothetical protein